MLGIGSEPRKGCEPAHKKTPAFPPGQRSTTGGGKGLLPAGLIQKHLGGWYIVGDRCGIQIIGLEEPKLGHRRAECDAGDGRIFIVTGGEVFLRLV